MSTKALTMDQLITDGQKLNTAIGRIGRKLAKTSVELHQLACSAIYHASEHGDTGYATRLVDALPTYTRRRTLVAWFEKFGGMRWVKDDKASAGGILKLRKNNREFDVEGAIQLPFWELNKGEGNPAPFTLDGLLKVIQGKFRKAESNGELHEGDFEEFQKRVRRLKLQDCLSQGIKPSA